MANPNIYLAAVLTTLVGLVTSCSPVENPEPETMERSVHFSDVVMVVTPRETYPWGGAQPDAYNALVDVSCIYKLKENVTVPKTVNITAAGYVAAMCHSTNLTAGRGDAIVFLMETDGRLEPNDVEKDASQANLKELAMVCGVTLTYPDGVTEGSTSTTCPKPGPPEDCKKYVEQEVPPPPPGAGGSAADQPDPAKVKGSADQVLPLAWSLVLTLGAALVAL